MLNPVERSCMAQLLWRSKRWNGNCIHWTVHYKRTFLKINLSKIYKPESVYTVNLDLKL